MGWDGFDNVEFTMELEDRLEISISDIDAEKLKNPAQLVDYLCARLNATSSITLVRCRSAEAFRAGRRRLANVLGRSVLSMRPAASINELLQGTTDVEVRRAEWIRLGRVLGISLPNLQHSARMRATATGIGVAIVLCGAVLANLWRDFPGGNVRFAVVIITLSLGVPWLFLLATRARKAGVLPNGFDTIGDLLSCLTVQTIPTTPQLGSQIWTRHELWELVRDLAAQNANCAPSKIRRETKWESL